MKVILLKDISGKGKAGELVEVTEGHGRNFLLPRGLALVAVPGVMKEAQRKIQKEEKRRDQEREGLLELARRIEGTEVKLQVRTGEDDRLFGSVTAADVAKELSRMVDFPIDKRKVELDKTLRQAGSYEVSIKLAQQLEPVVRVIIESVEA